MTEHSFESLRNRLVALAQRTAVLPPDVPVVVHRDDLLDLLDAVERLGRAMTTLDQRGRLR